MLPLHLAPCHRATLLRASPPPGCMPNEQTEGAERACCPCTWPHATLQPFCAPPPPQVASSPKLHPPPSCIACAAVRGSLDSSSTAGGGHLILNHCLRGKPPAWTASRGAVWTILEYRGQASLKGGASMLHYGGASILHYCSDTPALGVTRKCRQFALHEPS